MTVYVRNTETGGVVGVSEATAEDLLRSDAFEIVDRAPAPAKKAAAKPPKK